MTCTTAQTTPPTTTTISKTITTGHLKLSDMGLCKKVDEACMVVRDDAPFHHRCVTNVCVCGDACVDVWVYMCGHRI